MIDSKVLEQLVRVRVDAGCSRKPPRREINENKLSISNRNKKDMHAPAAAKDFVKVNFRGRNIFNGFLPAAFFRIFRARKRLSGAKPGEKSMQLTTTG